MKISGKGVKTIIVFLVIVALVADIIPAVIFFDRGEANMRMSGTFAIAYLYLIPIYFIYLIIAFAVIKLWNKLTNRER